VAVTSFKKTDFALRNAIFPLKSSAVPSAKSPLGPTKISATTTAPQKGPWSLAAKPRQTTPDRRAIQIFVGIARITIQLRTS
jgi:hypothetical protein